MQPTNICFFLTVVYAKKSAYSCLQVSGGTLQSVREIVYVYLNTQASCNIYIQLLRTFSWASGRRQETDTF